ncbi:hypothetical protein CRG98_014084 [Punica granatum]|uniref:DUF7745 domain-containing protein n=1 Tax=Punica granatum TaxID=22663 RepID=A0A2I0KAN2_PUNGR|nr:hypothetical protein CRG98_014084 [Punica granatum]
MDRPAPGLRLEAFTPPRQDLMRIWRTLRPVDHAFIQGIIGDMIMFTETPVDWIFLRTAIEFWDPEHVVFNFHGTELAPTIEEYTVLIQRPTPMPTTQGIFVPNPFATIRSQLSNLLGIPTQEIHQELHQGWDHGIRIAWLSDWTLLRALTPSTASYQRDACHRFLLLVFGTLLFPYSPNLIDGAIAQVVLQAVGGHSYVEALLAKTVRSLDYVRELLRMEALLARVDAARFLWVARWNPGGPVITGCPEIVGVPLLSHLGSTLVFPGRVIRQLGGLQDIPAEADRLPYRIQWADSTSTAPARFLQIREIHRQRGASTIQRIDIAAMVPRPPRLPELHLPPLLKPKAPPKRLCVQSYGPSGRNEIGFVASSSTPRGGRGLQGASDGVSSSTRPSRALRWGDGPFDREVGPSACKGARDLSPLGLAHALVFALARTFAALKPPPGAKGWAPLPPVSLTSSASDDQARITTLEGTVNQMATNMAELLSLLRGPNRVSSSSTPPPGKGPTVDPTPWVLPTQAPENKDAPAPPTLHTSMAHPFTSPYPPPPAPRPSLFQR